MTQQGERAIDVINAVSGFEYFTAKKATSLTGMSRSYVSFILGIMHKFGAITVVGKIGGTVKYQVSRNAIQIIENSFTEIFKQSHCVRGNEPLGTGMVIVDRANVHGMGNPLLRKLDTLLSGVRV